MLVRITILKLQLTVTVTAWLTLFNPFSQLYKLIKSGLYIYLHLFFFKKRKNYDDFLLFLSALILFTTTYVVTMFFCDASKNQHY